MTVDKGDGSSGQRVFNRTVVILSFVSLLNDISSEMLYPILPVYLKSIGFTVVFIGILEGFAEAVAGLSKGYFGKFSDATGRRASFVSAGYALSALSKPMLAFLLHSFWVFTARSLDRLGKGIRTAARDALISENSAPENKAKVFGFHRAMDTFGAVIGPLAALAYLHFNPGEYRNVFIIAFVPALIAVMLTFIVKDKKIGKQQQSTGFRSYFSFFLYWKYAGREFKLLTAGLFAFALVNSSDMFLLLMIKQLGFSDGDVITVYISFNLVVALSALPAGILADRYGYRKCLLAGLLVFAAAYGIIGTAERIELVYTAFFLYGLFPSLTDGVSKAWISNVTPEENTATALGFFTGLNSICVLLSSALAGLIWHFAGPEAVFAFASAGAVAVFAYFLIAGRRLIQSSR